MPPIRTWLVWRWLALTLAIGFGPSQAIAQDHAPRGAVPAPLKDMVLGYQPLSYPNGVVGSVMRRDRVLAKQLATLGFRFATQPFMRGADMVEPFAQGTLLFGFLGDMPATTPITAGQVWVVGLVEVQSNAIVSASAVRVSDLAGRRVGYVPISTAHSTLARAFASAGLRDADVTLVALSIAELPGALARRQIDAFAGWEPAVSMAMAASPDNHVIFRSQSVDYFVINREFERASPEAARVLIAGYVRAIEWMRQASGNLALAVRWTLKESQAFSGKPVTLSPEKVAAITRAGLLEVPSAPVIIRSPGSHSLTVEYELHRTLGKLPPHARWDHVESTFQYDGLRQVMNAARRYELRRFDYER